MNAFQWLFGKKPDPPNPPDLDGGRYLADLYRKDAIQANFLQRIITSVNRLAKNAGVGTVGEIAPPPPVDAVNVKVSGEMMHVTLAHNHPGLRRGVNYFVEVDTHPNFPQPIVHDLGASRSPAPFFLPTFTDDGTKQTYYVRAYAQYPGSKPSPVTQFGNGATIQMGGSTKMTMLASTGSGTASPTGQQGGQGLGKYPVSAKPNPFAAGVVAAKVSSLVAPVVSGGPVTFDQVKLPVGPMQVSQDNLPNGTTNFTRTSVHSSHAPTTNPLTGHDAGSNVTINIASHTMQVGATAVSNNSGSVTALSYSTLYYVYYDDPTVAGGAVSYQATTTKTTAISGAGRFFVGSVLTPAALAPDTTGNGDGGTGSQYGALTKELLSITSSSVGGAGTVSNAVQAINGNFTDFATLTAPGNSNTNSATLICSGGFGLVTGRAQAITVKSASFVNFDTSRGASYTATISYSLDSGVSFTTLMTTGASRGLTVDSATLSPFINPALIQFKCVVSCTVTGSGGNSTFEIYQVWIEIQE